MNLGPPSYCDAGVKNTNYVAPHNAVRLSLLVLLLCYILRNVSSSILTPPRLSKICSNTVQGPLKSHG
jgi:hypothetical protein